MKNPKKNQIGLAVIGVIAALLFYANLKELFLLFVISILLMNIKKTEICLATYIIAAPFCSVCLSGFQYVAILLIVCFSLFASKCKEINGNHFVVFLTVLIVMLCSFVGGVNPQADIMVLAIIAMVLLLGICVGVSPANVWILMYAYIISISCMIFVTFMEVLAGNNVFLYSSNRLAFYGNVRDMANACAIPLSFIIISYITKMKRLFRLPPLLIVIFTAVLSLALIMTLSRGAIIALISGVALSIVTFKKRSRLHIFVAVLISGLILFISFKSMPSNINRIFELSPNMNGRTDIWREYISTLFSSNILRVCFGFGPGSVTRLGISYLYAHSLFLDVLFSYGVVGFLFIIAFLARHISRFIKQKNAFILGCFITIVLCYISHGTVASFNFYIVTGLLSVIQKEELSRSESSNFMPGSFLNDYSCNYRLVSHKGTARIINLCERASTGVSELRS